VASTISQTRQVEPFQAISLRGISPLANQGKPDAVQRQRQRIQNDQDSRES
jgi:hypothetical protein